MRYGHRYPGPGSIDNKGAEFKSGVHHSQAKESWRGRGSAGIGDLRSFVRWNNIVCINQKDEAERLRKYL
jgi:hypothetical protein